MGWFKKRRDSDVVDFSLMQKKGLIPEAARKANEQGIVDLRTASSSGNSGSSEDFLSSLAGVGNSNNSSYSSGSITESLRAARRKNNLTGTSLGLNEMKIKLEDAEYRIRALESRIRELEGKLRSESS